jgi:CheY-like chemotaxis protein
MTAAHSLTVLLVDDHDDTREVIGKVLRRHGHRVVTAGDFAGAVRAARCLHFDVLVADIGLPDRSGLELLAEVRALYELPGIALSGFAMKQDVDHALAAGYVCHLPKPVDLKTLLAAIAEATRRPGPFPSPYLGPSASV